MYAKHLLGLVLPLAMTAACGTGAVRTVSSTAPHATSTASTPSAQNPPSACRTSALSVRLGTRGGAAGSVYAPIVFTNTGSSPCTLFGYPGVSYLAADKRKQVGASAARNPQHPAATVMLTPGSSASALVQMVRAANYAAGQCAAVTVSGLRVYPPNNTISSFVSFRSAQSACSTDVRQLAVSAVVVGTTGQ